MPDAARRLCAGLRAAAGLAVICAALALCSIAAAAAEPLSDAERAALQAKKAALFQELLHDPGNLDASFAYADAAARLGDDEAAVSALERMLLFNPDLPRVDLELGALYFRMGSFEVAKRYFLKAAAANPPPEVKERVQKYLAQIAFEEAPQQVFGYVLMGVQAQSDANVAPGSPLVAVPTTIGPLLLQLSNEFVKQRDYNIFASGTAQYSYDLGTQDRDTLEVGGTAYTSHYGHFGRLDLDLAEVNVGPRLRFPDPGLPLVATATLRPYAILNEVGLGEAQYFWTYGSGLDATAQLPAEIAARALFEFRQKSFTNAPTRPASTGLDGNDKLVSLILTRPVGGNGALGAEFDYLDQDTRFAFFGNKTYAVAASYKLHYRGADGTPPLPWETDFFASRSWSFYDAPDPCCDTGGGPSTRFDRHWRFGITQIFPMTETIAAVAQLQRDVVSSNLTLYGYTTNSILVGAQIRF